MSTIDIRQVKAQLSDLVDRAANGEVIVIAKAGKPVAKMIRLDAPPRLGFLKGEIKVPHDFDRMSANAVATLFGVEE